jgi:hypothetical protein
MIRPYHAQRRQGGNNPLGIGVIAVGTIVYLQDEGWWRDRYRGAPIRRNPWIVDAFLNGTMGAARRNRTTGLWEDLYLAGRSDMAVVRSLRDGRRRQVAIRTLILHRDHGLYAATIPVAVAARNRNVADAQPRALSGAHYLRRKEPFDAQ